MKNRVPALDGVRGLAILLVLLHHVWNSLGAPRLKLQGLLNIDVKFFPQMSFVGVELFFVLSGFLLFSQYLQRCQKGAPQVSYLSFLKKRLQRILPAYYVLLLAVFIFIPHVNQYLRLDRREGWLNFVNHLLFLDNFKPVDDSFPWVWSLAPEMQFYLILPLLTALLFKGANYKKNIYYAWYNALLFFSITVFYESFDGGHLLSFCLNQFLAGMMAAVWVFEIENNITLKEKSKRISILFQLVGLIFILFLMYVGPLRSLNEFSLGRLIPAFFIKYFWFPLVGLSFAILLTGVAISGGGLQRFWSNRALVFLGLISYGVFLWHYPILGALSRWSVIQSISNPFFKMVIFYVMALCLASLAGWFSYVFVERPFLRSKDKSNREVQSLMNNITSQKKSTQFEPI